MRRKIEAVFNKSLDRWVVDVPASLATGGKRYKARFKTRDEARKHLVGINGAEEPTAAIPPTLAMEADKARGILEAYGLDLVQAAREVAAALDALGGSGSILDACKAYRRTHDEKVASKPLREAVSAFLVTRENLRDSTRRSYEYTLQRALAPLADIILAEVTTADLEAILQEKKPTSRAMHRRTIGVFWKWASSPPREWCRMDILQAVEAPRTSSDKDIAILKPEAAKALLKAAEGTSPAAAVAFAIAIFGGVRMAELERLTWEAIGEDHIEIGRSIAKKHSRRLIPICPTLRAWIDTYRGEAKDSEPIVPSNWREVSQAARRRAGWAVEARLLENPPKPTRGPWPTNVCRHTCASVQVAIGTSLEDLTFKFGHSGGHELLRAHYVSRLTRKDAIAILSTGPKGSKISNLQAA